MAEKARKSRPDVGGIGISNPQRIIDERSGATKLQLAQYYLSVGDWLMPHLIQRPLSIVRTPDGVGGESFFQRHCGRLKMPHMRVLDKSLDPEHARLIQADSITAVVEAAQMGTVEFHTWNARSDRIDRPDRIVFDLDPDPELPWSSMIEATRLTLDLLGDLELNAFLKTSGGRGMHVVVPIDRRHDWECVNSFARSVTERLAAQSPEQIVAKMGPKNRVGKIFVDYLRNQRGSTAILPYSARAREGAPVAVPIAWGELKDMQDAHPFDIGDAKRLIDRAASKSLAGWGFAEQDLPDL